MASSMAWRTTRLSMPFSRATASAICSSSSRLALTPVSGIVITPFNHIHFAAVGRARPRRFAAGVDQYIGQHQLGIADIGERQLDPHRLGPRLLRWQVEANRVGSHAGDDAAKALAPG